MDNRVAFPFRNLTALAVCVLDSDGSCPLRRRAIPADMFSDKSLKILDRDGVGAIKSLELLRVLLELRSDDVDGVLLNPENHDISGSLAILYPRSTIRVRMPSRARAIGCMNLGDLYAAYSALITNTSI